jgi:hypothetical protein
MSCEMTSGAEPDGERYDGRPEYKCPQCGPVDVEEPFSPDNDADPMDVTPNTSGWVRCPCCGVLFSPQYEGSFRSGRHRACGQKLNILRPLPKP